jgi:hypothetical protein
VRETLSFSALSLLSFSLCKLLLLLIKTYQRIQTYRRNRERESGFVYNNKKMGSYVYVFIHIYSEREGERWRGLALAILSCKKVTKEKMEDGDFPRIKFCHLLLSSFFNYY